MIFLAVGVGVLLIAVVVAPFFLGKGGLLASSSSINSPDELERLKEAIANRYLEDEKAFHEGNLGGLAWEKRKHFLINRYIDVARRLDFLKHLQGGANSHDAGA